MHICTLREFNPKKCNLVNWSIDFSYWSNLTLLRKRYIHMNFGVFYLLAHFFPYFSLIWHFWGKILVPSWWKPEYLCGLQHIYIWMFFFDYAKVFQVMHAFISYAIWKKIVKVAFDVVKLTLRKRGKNEKGREGRFTLFFLL